jgi:hypothetical protein
MSHVARIVNYAQKLIDGTTRNTKDSLDFLEGFVYALLLVQEKAKELHAEEENRKN